VGGNAPRTEGSLLFLYVLLMQSRCGIIAAMQRLVFRGQTMTDSDVLAGLGLHGESVLHVVRRAVGGGIVVLVSLCVSARSIVAGIVVAMLLIAG
jgi:hypothetical protein